MIRRMIATLALAGLMALAGCGRHTTTDSKPLGTALPTTSIPQVDAFADDTFPGEDVTQTTTPDPGVEACKAVAQRVASGVAPTDAQRVAGWLQLQHSGFQDLRTVGVKLQRAWTAGTLADQATANVNASMACAAHGVPIKTE